MPTDTRSAVAEAIERLSSEPDETVDTDVGDAEPVGTAGDADGEVQAAPAPDAESAASPAARDGKGRFAKGGGKEPAAQGKAGADGAADPDAAAGQGAAADAQAQAAAAASALPKLNPPQDWRAAAKAEFAKAPRAVQEEALRLYGETRKTLDENASLRKEAGGWKEPLAPYEHLARRAGKPLPQFAADVFRTLDIIENGPAHQSIQALAHIFRTRHGNTEDSIRLLAQFLEGGGQQPAATPQTLHPEQIRQLARQEWENAQREQGTQAAVRVWQDFEKSADLLNEQGVRADLADLAGKWERENPGQAPTKEVFQKLYDRACQLNDGASKIVNQRKEAAAAKAKKTASTQASAAAASGVKSEPGGPSGAPGPAKDTREEVARQFRKARQARV